MPTILGTWKRSKIVKRGPGMVHLKNRKPSFMPPVWAKCNSKQSKLNRRRGFFSCSKNFTVSQIGQNFTVLKNGRKFSPHKNAWRRWRRRLASPASLKLEACNYCRSAFASFKTWNLFFSSSGRSDLDSVTRFGKIFAYWAKFGTFWQSFEGSFSNQQYLKPNLGTFLAIGQICHGLSGQIFNK